MALASPEKQFWAIFRASRADVPTAARPSSDSSERAERQLEGIRAGSRTTYPLTQIFEDSSSSSFQPVLPTCGAVITTTCRWYEGSVNVSW